MRITPFIICLFTLLCRQEHTLALQEKLVGGLRANPVSNLKKDAITIGYGTGTEVIEFDGVLYTQLFTDIKLDYERYGQVEVILEGPNHEIFIETSYLEKTRYTGKSYATINIDGIKYCDLLALEGVIVNANDDRTSIELGFLPEFLDEHVIGEHYEIPELTPSSFAASLNYSLNGSFGKTEEFQSELALSPQITLGNLGFVKANANISYQNGTAQATIGGFVYNKDFVNKRVRLLAGEISSNSDLFGSGAAGVGISVKKIPTLFGQNELASKLNHKGVAHTPSTLITRVNGKVRGEEDLPVGPFHIKDYSAGNGFNKVEFEVKPKDGSKSSVFKRNFTSSANLLKPNATSYSFDLGFLKQNENLTLSSAEEPSLFKQPYFVVNGALGATEWLSFKTQVELSRQHRALGFGATVGLAQFGFLDFSAAMSDGKDLEDSNSYRYEVGYNYTKGNFNLELNHLYEGGNWASLGNLNTQNTTRSTGLSSSYKINKHNFVASAKAIQQKSRLTGTTTESKNIEFGYAYGAETWDLGLVGKMSIGSTNEKSVGIRFSKRLGGKKRFGSNVLASKDSIITSLGGSSLYSLEQPGATVSLSANASGNFQKSKEEIDRDGALDVSGLYKSNALNASISTNVQKQGDWKVAANLKSAFAFANGKLVRAARIGETFAIVNTGDARGVIAIGNGKSAPSGRNRATVVSLTANKQNLVEVDARNLNLDYRLGNSANIVNATRGGAYLINFDIAARRDILLRLVDQFGNSIPDYSVVRDGSGNESGFVGYEGETYIGEVKPGKQTYSIAELGCKFTVNVPDKIGDIILDQQVCK